ncbi:pyridoxamine 5'-phosphate oxidase [Gynuella sunshinyii]|uniref:Pyridoxine/pyridoxamine 5'-phosphate oxidase n=1 Tax=Gynuella sunshinyii YC6258 TaxID=1445510 RepID=A0A0C5W195_9GAMM|nr:pyridoxamine 5'-phosphate oxidase [Gynuella sunshinyii]AJQ96459.1 pyridoxamine-phosphate oxidase [Gynuella sunshinyii YC6258]
MDLSDIRREYLQGGLRRENLLADPIDQFEAWFKDSVKAKVNTDPTAMCMATVGPDGRPSQRIVLLKHFDQRGFVFYTNLGSRKAREIEHNPNVCLHFGWVPLERQVIIYGRARQLSVTETTAYFLSRPRESRIAAWTSHQSQKISGRKMLEQAFAQMKARFAEGDIPLPSFWGGYRVEATEIEFWQGGGNRLHDRFMYSKDETGQWQIDRLQP